ncbi:ribosomal protein L15, partial [Prunus dulcis]
GNVRNLGQKLCCIPSLKVTSTTERRRLVVVNKAASTGVGAPVTNVRFRLDNLGPQPGSRKKGKRKGRGIAAGQGNSCGFGMRGQKSRSGPGAVRCRFIVEFPNSRELPEVGLPKYVPVNLKDIEAAGFQEGEEGFDHPSGRERKLPLKILGDGELSVKLDIKARAFSAAAKEKLEAAGCNLTVLPGRKKWVKPSVAKNLARADEYFAKKRAAAAAAAESAPA